MRIRAALPSLKEIRTDDFTVYISYVPPLITEADSGEGGELLREIKRKMSTGSVCSDFVKCFAWIYGGVVVYRRGVILRKELQGYVSFSPEAECNEEGINAFLTSLDSGKDKWCVKLDKDTISFSKTKRNGYRWVDNVGLRFIVL